MIKALLRVVQVVAVAGALVFVVALFANEPDPVRALDAGGEVDGGAGDGAIDGSQVYAERCASCHGPSGGGGAAPKLSDGKIVDRFPDIDDQIRVVTDGQGAMPSFDGRLTAEEIAAVVEYTRTL